MNTNPATIRIEKNDKLIAEFNEQARTIAAQAETIRKLTKFVNAFLDNFKDCEFCNGTGWDKLQEDNCLRCHGSGEQIDSVGVLFIDLPDTARALLAEVSHE